MKSGTKWLIGCGTLVLAAFAVAIVLLFIGARLTFQRARQVQERKAAERAMFVEELRESGFTNEVASQSVTIEGDINEPTIYDCQSFKLLGNCSTDLCVLAQTCEIHGNVDGKLIFRGQVLRIKPGAVINGDLDVDATVIEQEGEVRGDISGGATFPLESKPPVDSLPNSSN